MIKSKVDVKRATQEDFVDFFGRDKADMPGMVAWCGKVGGKIIGFGGYYRYGGRWHAFCDLKPEAADYKRELAYYAYRAMQHAQKSGIKYLYAELESEHEGASAWLQRMGFHLDPRSLYYFRWKAK